MSKRVGGDVTTQWQKVSSLRALLEFTRDKTVQDETDAGGDYGVVFHDGSALRVVTDCSVWSSWTQDHDVAFWATAHLATRDHMFTDLPD
jgi:hypothetical protein